MMEVDNEHFDWMHLDRQITDQSFDHSLHRQAPNSKQFTASNILPISEVKALSQRMKTSIPTPSALEDELLLMMATKEIEALMILLKVGNSANDLGITD
jgi:hypothetical protein